MPTTESFVLPEMPAADSVATVAVRPSGSVPPPASPSSGSAWPHVRGYDILSVIGSGGMGVVYKARHRDLRRTVAIKMLRGADLADPESHGRFRDEAEAVARLQHPNIIQVFEIGTVELRVGDFYPAPFIALEFVEGGSLTRLTDRPQPPREAAGMVEKLARAVHSAHGLGVVHRDLKPANVLLTPEGEPKIADFGVAKFVGAEGEAGGRFPTLAGTVIGTPEYMAPEQARGDAPTPAVDVYALGAILYELLAARVPFRAASAVETMHLLRYQEPVPPRQLQPGLPRDLETICLKCLEKDPGKRYATADALADDLRRFLDDRPIRARRSTEAEKVARWCRRNPLVAGSLAGVACIFLAAFALVSWSYWRAEAALSEEANQRQEAQRKEKAERWERYRANLVAAGGALQVSNIGGARRTLEDAPEEYRNWEWRHFQSRLDLAQHVLRSDEIQSGGAWIAPNGNRVGVCGEGGFLRVFETADGREVRTFRDAPELWGATVSADGKTLAYRPKDHTIVLRDVDTGRIRATLRGHDRNVHVLEFSEDASRVITASLDRTVRVWDAATGRSLRVMRPYESEVARMQVSADGRRFVASSQSNKSETRLWDLDTGRAITTLAGHERGYQWGYFDRRGERLVTVEKFPGNELKLWDATTGRLIAAMGRHPNTVTDVAFSSDGSRIASSSMDQTVRLWDGRTGRPVATLEGHRGRVTRVAFSQDGKRLISGSEDHTVRLWESATGRPLAALNGHTGAVARVQFAPDGRIVSASDDASVRLWDAQMMEDNGILRGHSTFVYSVVFHPDGKRVVSAGWDGTVRVWDATTGRQKALLNHGENVIVSSVALHPAGRLLATRTRGSMFLWDMATGRKLARWDAPSDTWRDTCLAFSPDGGLLASGCQGKVVRLWDVATRAQVAELRGHTDEVNDVAFSPDGKWLASAGENGDRAIRIWDVATKQQVHVLEGHRAGIFALAFSRDGTRLASGCGDGSARLWDTATWRGVATLKLGTNVYGIAFTPDGTRLACACADNSILLWDVATHQPVAELRGHTDYVHAVAFSPDGTRLVSASGDFTVRIWDTVRPHDRRPTGGK